MKDDDDDSGGGRVVVVPVTSLMRPSSHTAKASSSSSSIVVVVVVVLSCEWTRRVMACMSILPEVVVGRGERGMMVEGIIEGGRDSLRSCLWACRA